MKSSDHDNNFPGPVTLDLDIPTESNSMLRSRPREITYEFFKFDVISMLMIEIIIKFSKVQ